MAKARERRERREEFIVYLARIMEIRDTVFWWIGVWALFTGLDVGAVAMARALYRRKRRPRRTDRPAVDDGGGNTR